MMVDLIATMEGEYFATQGIVYENDEIKFTLTLDIEIKEELL